MVYQDTKPHFLALDGLRGVAALIVITYHIFEGYASSPINQIVNHGYLAVDFFFLLSGFVIGFAYDDRWKKGELTIRDYVKRRLVRLHPLVLFGAIWGIISFLIQGSIQWDGSPVSFGRVGLALLMTMIMIPALPSSSADIRGYGEMFPVNGPQWSLFFEYLGNILYALFLRKASTKTLKIIVGLSGIGLLLYAVTNQSGSGNIGGGWSLGETNFLCGCLRLLFSYSAGLLMARISKPRQIKNGFLISALALLLLLPLPHLGILWLNGLFEVLMVTLIFPILLWIGASSYTVSHPWAEKVYSFLGDISYPVYMVHYPLMYLLYAHLWENELTFAESWHLALLVVFSSILFAHLVYKYYDRPLRTFLSKKYINRK